MRAPTLITRMDNYLPPFKYDPSDPMELAWRSYKKTDGYAEARRAALCEHLVDSSMWLAFAQGWCAAKPSNPKLKRFLSKLKRITWISITL